MASPTKSQLSLDTGAVCKSMWVRVGYVELRGGEVEAVCWGISSSGRALA